jgi:hypothetical protein
MNVENSSTIQINKVISLQSVKCCAFSESEGIKVEKE